MSKARDSPIEDITPSGSQTEHGSNVTLANLHGDLLHIFHSRVEENSEVIWMSKSFTYILFSHVQADRWRHAAELVRGLGCSTTGMSDRVTICSCLFGLEWIFPGALKCFL